MLQVLVTLELMLLERVESVRTHRDDRGQTAAEYLGIVVVVAVIVGLLATTDIGDKIKAAILAQIDKISSKGPA